MKTLMTVFGTVLVLSLMACRGVIGSTCSTTAAGSNIPVVAMCTSSLGNGSRVVIDTFDSLSYGTDECVCTGTVTSTVSTSTQLYINPLPTIQSEPGGSGCGSSIAVQLGDRTSSSSCVLLGSIEVTNSDTVTVKWKLDIRENVYSKYCVLLRLRDGDDFSISLTCTAVTTTTTTTTDTTKPSITTSAPTTSSSTTLAPTTPSTTTLAPSDSVTTEQTTDTDTTVPDTGSASTTEGGQRNDGSKDESEGLPVEIVAPAAGGAVLVIIIIIVVVIVCKRNKKPDVSLTKNVGTLNGDGRGYDGPYAAVNMAMDNNDQSGIRKNELYVSADDTMIVENAAANSNNVYAEVQKKPKVDQEKSTNQKQSTAELSDYSTPGPVYAAVNKRNQKQPDGAATPSRYTSPDGLVYASVDVQSADPSQVPIPPPKRFSDPTPEQDRVVYSEIATEL